MRKFAMGLLALVLVVAFGAVASAAEFEFKYGGGLSEEHPHTIAHRFFAKRVGELTNGKVDIQVFPSNQLGAERERIEQIQMGTLDFTKTMTAVLSNFLPEISVFSLPYLFRDKDHWVKVMNGPIGNEFFTKMEKSGLKGIAWYYAGTRSIYNSKRPIKTPADMKGLKIRVPENAVLIDTMNAMGGTGVPVNLAEIYTAIRTGVVDGAENSTLFYYEQKHSEVAKFYSYTNHSIDVNIAMMSIATWNKLPDDVKKAIEQAGKETEKFLLTKWAELEADFNEKLKTQGIQFNETDEAAFRESAKVVWEKHGKTIPAAIIETIVNTK